MIFFDSSLIFYSSRMSVIPASKTGIFLTELLCTWIIRPDALALDGLF